jgi:NADH:ubiquinone oxidoreductase subunit 6 (subunit J)
MTLAFIVTACLTVGSAVAAMTLRNLVHCALALAITFAGLAALYLQLSAQFVGLAQILVYVGAVAILIVFAILLTRSGEPGKESIFSGSWIIGAGVALGVFALLVGLIRSSRLGLVKPPVEPQVTVANIGQQMMSQYVLPLEVMGLLLTAALIGAVLIAMKEKDTK